MSTVIPHGMMARRALTFLLERRAEEPGLSLSALLDEAGRRFNLSPADAEALEHLIREAEQAGRQS